MGWTGRTLTNSVLSGCLATVFAWPVYAQSLPRQNIIREVEQELRTVLEKNPKGLRLDRVFYRDELHVPDGKVTWTVKSDDLRQGRQTIPVEVAVNGKVTNTIQVAITLKKRIRYLTLARPLKRGEVVTEADLTWEEGEFDRAVSGLMQDPKQVIGLATSRQVQADKPLQLDWFVTPMVIKRGERVQVTTARGALQIEMVGVAQSAGRVGETIQLENPASHRRFDARVTGPGQAQVMTW
ncbi:MAG: flagellar basal body P-ring formation protein FlgA [Magnetococcales bacterium]|nr:flagellar basal body P-ring formation protein FlgA [Magnetococcales bacterium]MBF0438487.1 flagellar basal body P-ring formation protein FlgA [Magnetococcales bacterium]